MPKLKGFFDCFAGIESVTAEKIGRWLSRTNPAILENELANHLFYSQTVPVTATDAQFYLAVLREALKIEPDLYYNREQSTVYIPECFLHFFPDFGQMVGAYRDSFSLKGVIAVRLKSGKTESKMIGTLIRPFMVAAEGGVELWVEGRNHTVSVGSVTRIPAPPGKIAVEFVSDAANLPGQEKAAFTVEGGELGIILDLGKNN